MFFEAGPAHDPDGSRRVRHGMPVFGIDLCDLRDSSHSLGSPRRLSAHEAKAVTYHISSWAAANLAGTPYDLHREDGIEDETGTLRPYPHVSKRDRKKFASRFLRGLCS